VEAQARWGLLFRKKGKKKERKKNRKQKA